MKEFEIRIEGEWFFNYTYNANSKEEALEKALQHVCDRPHQFDLIILGQYANDEKFDKPMEGNLASEGWSTVYFGESVINTPSGD